MSLRSVLRTPESSPNHFQSRPAIASTPHKPLTRDPPSPPLTRLEVVCCSEATVRVSSTVRVAPLGRVRVSVLPRRRLGLARCAGSTGGASRRGRRPPAAVEGRRCCRPARDADRAAATAAAAGRECSAWRVRARREERELGGGGACLCV